jgi:hypothetical protein
MALLDYKFPRYCKDAGMSSRAKNTLIEFCELQASIGSSDTPDAPMELTASLRIEPAELENEKGTFLATIGAIRAFLKLEFDGLEISPGPRFGDLVRGDVTTKTSLTTTATGSTKLNVSGDLTVAASGDLPKAGAALGAGISKDVTTTLQQETTIEQKRSPVRAMAGGRWEVYEDGKKPLQGAYLQNQVLCGLEAINGANRKALSVVVEVKQRDLTFKRSLKGCLSKLSLTDAKLANILIAKSIAEHGAPGKYNGTIKLSQVDLGDE